MAGLGQDQEGLVKFSVEWYGLGFDRVGSVLTSTKTTEMVLASLFCFILPISFQKIEKQVNQYSKKLARPFQNFFLLVFMLICSIGISKLSNKTAMVGIATFALLFNIRKFSVKGIFILFLMILSLFFYYQDFIMMLYTDNFIKVYYKWGQSEGRTVLQQIFDLPRLIANYEGFGFFDYVFGRYISVGIASSQPFSDASVGSELRLLTSPFYFGFILTGIVIAIAITIIKYCFNMMKQDNGTMIHFSGLFVSRFLLYCFFRYPLSSFHKAWPFRVNLHFNWNSIII